MDPTEYVPSEDVERVRSPKRCVFEIKTGRWIMFRNAVIKLIRSCTRRNNSILEREG
jgi:hypothetical protein